DPHRKTVYVVPTRTLAEEVYGVLKEYVENNSTQVAISTRERSEFDDHLTESSVVVATYEKLDALLKRGQLERGSLSHLLFDEVQKISDRERGIGLEFVLAKAKSGWEAQPPQIVALSGMVREDDARELSSWLGGKLVTSLWKPVDLDEAIFADGKLFH